MSDRVSRDDKRAGCIVAIGGSAGVLEALERFFRALPDQIDASYVVLHHMDPEQKSLLPELLVHWTKLPVEFAQAGVKPKRRHIYVRQQGTVLELKDDVFVTRPEGRAERERHPIDVFMTSLAQDYEGRSVGIIVSGTGTDGTNGLRAIRKAGGGTFAQEPSEARFDGMPASAVSAGVADRVKPVAEIAKDLSGFIECAPGAVSEAVHADQLTTVCRILEKKTGHDFTSYKKSTVARRVERRVQACSLPDIQSYIQLLALDPAEPRALLRDLLISVTQFFRDPDAFIALQREVLPKLFEGVSDRETVRAWVPACATGEEAYTIAILLRDYQERNHPQVSLQIFATDIDRAALEYARHGLYPLSIEEHVPKEFLTRYFRKTEKGYQALQELREICIFSEHSLLKHPPFSRIDLISCRNLFIYWEPDLQNRILPVFHYALNPGGFLFLGPAESVATESELFKVVDKKNRLFQRTGTVSRNRLSFPIAHIQAGASVPSDLVQRGHAAGERDPGKAITSALLEDYAPPAFVVSEHGEIAYYSGRTGRYIEPPTGVPSNNVFDVVCKQLRPELHALLHRCIKTRSEVSHPGAILEKDGIVQRLNLVVRPLGEITEEPDLYLMVIQEVSSPKSKEEALNEGMALPEGSPLVEHLEEELRDTRERLQSTIEEVKSSNEELLSMNEELQSANEELQTSKEELQSTNEELQTVNSELAKKVEELDSSNSDLQNFFHGTQIPILFLDRDFRIQKFTPAATGLFRLIPTDQGRRIMDITSLLEGTGFISDCASVLQTLQPIDREVRTTDHAKIYLMRVSPYRTLSNVIAGVIVAFSDITELKKAQETKSILAAIVESSSDAIVGRDLEGKVTSWNAGAERIFGFSAREAVGRPITLIIPPDREREYHELTARVLHGKSVSDVETERVRKDGSRISVAKTMSPIRGERGDTLGLSIIYRDISDRKRAEMESAKLAAIVRSSNDAIISKDLSGTITSWNEAATAMFGYTADEAVGRSIKMLIPRERLSEEDMILGSIHRGETITHYESERLKRDGTRLQVSLSISPMKDSDGKIIGAAKIARDITRQKNIEAQLNQAIQARDDFLSIASHELKTPLTTLKMQVQMRKRRVIEENKAAFSMQKLRKMIESDEHQISRLSRLIDDMLDIARIGSGKLSVKPEVCDLADIVKEVADRIQEQINEAGCELELDIRSSARGEWDRFRIEQVVMNLLINAMKYGAGKPILVRVESSIDMATLTVQDRGSGIAEKDRERIFERFERAVSRSEVTGLGLGLYIVREILKAHGGAIRVESQLGQGSSFVVTLPLNQKGVRSQ